MVAVIEDDDKHCVMCPYEDTPIVQNSDVVKVFTNNLEL